ncbi:hypothetical protein OUZ56_002034 [Daphnia magna]|uniref:Uncharacterized protein n=1 Tax=Daphnia magna TaxID=35525 RepID=A0ABR0A4I3_9CRUS|nr:hypothetical protein OUZ56_002034 [Daphnia magna]
MDTSYNLGFLFARVSFIAFIKSFELPPTALLMARCNERGSCLYGSVSTRSSPTDKRNLMAKKEEEKDKRNDHQVRA